MGFLNNFFQFTNYKNAKSFIYKNKSLIILLNMPPIETLLKIIVVLLCFI